MQYRREIDGLRALAIVPVVLYHAGFAFFAGGFLGVDVFFVISGFLITSLIHEEMGHGRFSFRRFYERRVRRLFPPLLAVAIVSMPFAWAWVPPREFVEYAQSLVAVALFIANLFFHAQSGYFDTSAELKPFLHMWSLSIEEQFYFVFPLALLLLLTHLRRWSYAAMLAVAAASYAASQAVVDDKPGAAFFFFHLRVWELLFGGACALAAAAHGSTLNALAPRAKEALSLCGLLALAASVLGVGAAMRHPGPATWMPVVGTALVLVFAMPGGPTARLLGWRPLVGIGLVSYGAYLWHQPIFALVRQRNFAAPGSLAVWALIALTFTMATLSWWFVERPVRSGRVLPRNRIFVFWAAGTLLLLVAGAIGMEKDGWSARFKLPADVAASLTDRSPRGACEPYTDANGFNASFCWLGAEPRLARRKIALFGDSHAYPITAAFDGPAKERGIAIVKAGLGGCLPLVGANVMDGPNPFGSCAALARRELDLVETQGIDTVFLIARWSLYTSEGYTENKMYHAGATLDEPRTLAHSIASFEAALKQTARAYAAMDTKVYVVAQISQQITHPLSMYFKIHDGRFQGDPQAALDFASIPFERHLSIQRTNRAIIEAVAAEGTGLELLVLDDVFCSPALCRMGTPEHAYYTDTNHVSTDGALLAQKAVGAVLDRTAGPRAIAGTTPTKG